MKKNSNNAFLVMQLWISIGPGFGLQPGIMPSACGLWNIPGFSPNRGPIKIHNRPPQTHYCYIPRLETAQIGTPERIV